VNSLILDAGALIGIDRSTPEMLRRIARGVARGDRFVTHPLVVAQVWRDPGGQQANLSRALRSVLVTPIDEGMGRRAGELCGAAGTDDPIDAVVALMARTGDRILTSDPDDITHLLGVRGVHARVVAV
jgi:hypothetical protein